MNIYIICAVRNADSERAQLEARYAQRLRREGHNVHYPPDSAPQDDVTGAAICEAHKAAMLEANEVHVLWDSDSKGSHFDLGMAYALSKPIRGIRCYDSAIPTKSYWNAVIDPR
jgi:hypothetical protein